VPDPDDRRVLGVELTDEGLALCERLVPGMAEFMAEMSHGFTVEEQSNFRDFLRRFYYNASHSFQG
jgi:DNA-binding MarR family transcriptional regulator